MGPHDRIDMKKIILAAAIVLALVSCTPKKQLYNLKPDGTQTDFIVDMHACAQQAELDKGGGFLYGPANYVAAMMLIRASTKRDKIKNYQECMEALGYACTKNCYKP